MGINIISLIILIIQINLFKNLYIGKNITENEKGEIGNYSYELWKEDGDKAIMTLNGEGKFSCSWENAKNVLFLIGKRWNSTKTYKEIGNIKANFEFEFNSNSTYHYGIYGWTQYPLIEFFIMENWEMPPLNSEKLGTISVDGSTYDMYKTRLNFGFDTETIIQLWNIRRKKRNKGTVSVNEHFKAWEENGNKLGKMYEVTFCVEGYRGYGHANVTKNEIIIE